MTPEQQPNGPAPNRPSHQGPGPPQQSLRTSIASTGLSSHGTSRKRLGSGHFDRSAYTAGQTLVTVVNDPRLDAAKNWSAWLGFRVPDVSWQDPPPPIDTMRYPPVTRRDLARYLALISGGSYDQFQQARQSLALGGISQQMMALGGDSIVLDDDDHESYDRLPYEAYSADAAATNELNGDPDQHPSDSYEGATHSRQRNDAGEPSSLPGFSNHRPAAVPPRLKQGDGLVTALQVVPRLFFNEDFSLSRPDIFEAICGCEDDSEMFARIDKLNAALDVVETQLMREIASRSRAIVAAGNCVHDLHNRLSATLAHIKQLRENVSDMDDVTYSATVRVAQLQQRRNNLSATVERVKSLEEVAAAKAALPLLLESGDYAGALELLDNLSHAAAGLSSSGVAAFRSLAPQLADSRSVVESLLTSEMLGAAMYTDAHLVLERAVAESAQALGLAAATAPLALSPADNNGGGGGGGGPFSADTSPSPSFSVSSASGLVSRECSLRSSGSSSLLAAELAAAREQLHDRLLPVVLGLHRCDRLEAALRQFAVNRAAEVKAIIREVVERLLPVHLQMAGIAMDGGGGAAPAAPLVASGAAAGAAAGPVVADIGDGGSGMEMPLSEKLAALPHLGFLQILMVINSMVEAYLAHSLLVGSLVEDALRSGRAPAAALAAPRREVHSALQAVVDVSTGRWAKLMAARSDVHSRLKVYEFRALLSTCETFAGLPDLHGVRPGAALRPTLQALCRAHLEKTHARSAMQMQHLLEAEQWVPVEAHASFQAIVDRMEARCPGARQPEPSPEQQPAAAAESSSLSSEQQQEGGMKAAEVKAAVVLRPTEGLLRLGGRQYWPVNALLMLLKLLDEHYMGLLPSTPPSAAVAAGPTSGSTEMAAAGPPLRRPVGPFVQSSSPPAQAASWALSTVGPDVAQRCLELLRSFNMVTAQQVLGAGAMRTAGLKSISAKHLALAAQSLAALLAALPLLRWQLGAAISDPARRALVMPEFDRLAQDLNLHVEEIHGKLVDIMQDRVLAACRQVAVDSDAWSRADPSLQARQVAQPAPSEALRLLARQLNTLRSVLQPILQPEEVSYIFGRVAAACSESLAGLLDSLPPPLAAAATAATATPTNPVSSGASGLLRGFGGGAAAAAAAAAAAEAQALTMAAWEASRRANALFMLQALSTLPLDPSRASSYATRLATFYTKHYGLLQPATAAAATAAASAAVVASVPVPVAAIVPEARSLTPPDPEGRGPENGPLEGSAASGGPGESAAAAISLGLSTSSDAASSSSPSSPPQPRPQQPPQPPSDPEPPQPPSDPEPPQPPEAAAASVGMDERPEEDVGSLGPIPTPPLPGQQDQEPKQAGGGGGGGEGGGGEGEEQQRSQPEQSQQVDDGRTAMIASEYQAHTVDASTAISPPAPVPSRHGTARGDTSMDGGGERGEGKEAREEEKKEEEEEEEEGGMLTAHGEASAVELPPEAAPEPILPDLAAGSRTPGSVAIYTEVPSPAVAVVTGNEDEGEVGEAATAIEVGEAATAIVTIVLAASTTTAAAAATATATSSEALACSEDSGGVVQGIREGPSDAQRGGAGRTESGIENANDSGSESKRGSEHGEGAIMGFPSGAGSGSGLVAEVVPPAAAFTSIAVAVSGPAFIREPQPERPSPSEGCAGGRETSPREGGGLLDTSPGGEAAGERSLEDPVPRDSGDEVDIEQRQETEAEKKREEEEKWEEEDVVSGLCTEESAPEDASIVEAVSAAAAWPPEAPSTSPAPAPAPEPVEVSDQTLAPAPPTAPPPPVTVFFDPLGGLEVSRGRG